MDVDVNLGSTLNVLKHVEVELQFIKLEKIRVKLDRHSKNKSQAVVAIGKNLFKTPLFGYGHFCWVHFQIIYLGKINRKDEWVYISLFRNHCKFHKNFLENPRN